MNEQQQFAIDIRKFCEKVGNRAHLVVRKIVLDIGTKVVMRSPVGDPSHWQNPAPKGYTGGHFRANWQYSEGAIPQGVLPVIDKSGRVSLERIKVGLGPKPWGKIHFIVNNLPYGPRLETGWSKQAPGGMVGLTVSEFQAIIRKANKEANA